ncbi:MAG TPA: PH domain-containing protein [bacterium]|nr:PH domain-containing protein [bacterium]
MLNKLLTKKISLRADERIENIIRRSGRYFFLQAVIAAALLLLAFFLIYPLFNWGWPGVIGFCLLIVMGLGLTLRIYWSYYFTTFIMTDRRIIDLDQRGFLNFFITSVLYSKIQDVSFKKKFLSPGELTISLIGERKTIIQLVGINQPQKLAAEILAQQDNYRRRKTYQTNQRAVILLEKIKNKLGEERFNSLVAD